LSEVRSQMERHSDRRRARFIPPAEAGASLILRSDPKDRVSKDEGGHCARGHPSRLAQEGEHLRMRSE
jgi:hypothetical protein